MPDPYEPIVRLSPPPPDPPAYVPRDLWSEEAFSGERQPRARRPRSEETWAAAREDYEIGLTAESICHKLGLSLSTFRTRARREGWRREDQAMEDEAIPAEAAAEEPLATEALIDLAHRGLSNAVRRGRVYEARAWMRLVAELEERLGTERWRARMAERTEAGEPATAPLSNEEVYAVTTEIVRKTRAALRDAGSGETDPSDEANAIVAANAAGPQSRRDGLHPLHPESTVQSPRIEPPAPGAG